jgi:hypothetical protein
VRESDVEAEIDSCPTPSGAWIKRHPSETVGVLGGGFWVSVWESWLMLSAEGMEES